MMKRYCIFTVLILFTLLPLFLKTDLISRTSQRKYQMRKIEVIYPNGGEQWRAGNSYQVKWREYGKIGSVKVVLRACPDGPRWILGTVEKEQKKFKHFFHISQKYSGYAAYRIRVVSVDGSLRDSSDSTFTIEPMFDKKLIRLKPIQILSPARKSHTCWNLGKEYRVKIKLNGEGTVNLKIKLDGPADTIELMSGILNAPRVFYQPLTIPANYPQGYYYITAVNIDNPEDQDRTKVAARRQCK